MTAQDYDYPHMPSIRKARLVISNDAYITLSDLYVPALKKELMALINSLNETDTLYNKNMSEASTALKTGAVSSYSKAIEKLKEKGDGDQEAIKEHEKSLKDELEKYKKDITDHRDKLTEKLSTFSTVKLSDNTTELAFLDRQRKALVDTLPADQAELTSLRAEKKDLDKAIREFESTTFIDRLRPIIQELDKTLGGGGESSTAGTAEGNTAGTAAGTTAGKTIAPSLPSFAIPEESKKLVKGGIAVASKILDIVNEKIKYDNLIDARKKIKKDIENLQKSMSEIQKKVDVIDDNKDQLMVLLEVVEPKKNYVKESEKITNSFTLFLDHIFPAGKDLDKQDDLLAASKDWVKNCPLFNKYLSDVQYYWLRSGV
jgi:peptidoglycan hydrolase CwlO-like protein